MYVHSKFFLFLFVNSVTVQTQHAFVAGREGPGAGGPRPLSSITFRTPGVSIDATPVRIHRTRRQDPYKTTKRNLGQMFKKNL